MFHFILNVDFFLSASFAVATLSSSWLGPAKCLPLEKKNKQIKGTILGMIIMAPERM